MATTAEGMRVATGSEIREIIGPADDALMSQILAVGASRDEIIEAYAWLGSDDYLARKLHHGLTGRAAQVVDLLDAEMLDPEMPDDGAAGRYNLPDS